jgi:uncharacterized protein (TIGR02284 family)
MPKEERESMPGSGSSAQTANRRRLRVVLLALGGNFAIAVAKFAAAAFTGSSAMASEGVHSLVDTSNELLLLHGLRRSQAPPSAAHPFGHGREVYFWSFMVALLIFALGACVSLYGGVLHLLQPRPLRDLGVNYAVLGVSCVFEGISWRASWRELRRADPSGSVFEAVRRSKDPSTFTVFLEDSVALAGLAIAAIGIAIAHALGRPEADAIASIAIAILLALASMFLARETKALLIGEQAHPRLRASLLRIAAADAAVQQANGVVTAQLGPDRVLAALSAEFPDELRTPDIEDCVARLEQAIRQAHPEVVVLFVKPQVHAVWARRRERLDHTDAFAAPARDSEPNRGMHVAAPAAARLEGANEMSPTHDLRDLLSALRDGVMFYAEAGEHAEQPAHRELFAQMATQKRAAARSIEKLLAPPERPSDGTWSGKIRECYARVRAQLSSDKDAVFIKELEAAEDRIIEEFRHCLSTVSDVETRRVLEQHYPVAVDAHERMRRLKQAVEAK